MVPSTISSDKIALAATTGWQQPATTAIAVNAEELENLNDRIGMANPLGMLEPMQL